MSIDVVQKWRNRVPPFDWVIPFSLLYLFAALILAWLADFKIFSTAVDKTFVVYNGANLGIAVLLLFGVSKPPKWQVAVIIIAAILSYFIFYDKALIEQTLWPTKFSVIIGPAGVLSSGCAVLLMAKRVFLSKTDVVHRDAGELFWGLIFVLIYSVGSIVWLQATYLFHPLVIDGRIYSIDASLGVSPSVWVAKHVRDWSWLMNYARVAYQYMYMGFIFVFAVQVYSGGSRRWHAISAWFGVSCIGMLAYHVAPVMGPSYYFGEYFPAKMFVTEIKTSLVPTVATSFFRNGMPSLHFGWSFAVWLIALSMPQRWCKWLTGIVMLSMVLATLSLGEHYLLDLVVAVPFILFTMSLLVLDLPWSDKVRWRAAWVSGGLYVMWMILILWGYPVLLAVKGLTLGLMLVTLGLSFWVGKGLVYVERS